eukprot:SAG11_NODE_2028_length_3906_cov_1.458892_2_plen_105_part_00
MYANPMLATQGKLKTMFLCKVALGRAWTTESDMPQITAADVRARGCDSVHGVASHGARLLDPSPFRRPRQPRFRSPQAGARLYAAASAAASPRPRRAACHVLPL